MKIRAKIDYENKTVSGKPSIQFFCDHCKLWYIGHNLDTYFWNSTLCKQDLEKAVADFVDRLNKQQIHALFPKRRTGENMLDVLCHCDPKVVDIANIRSVKKAQSILEAGLRSRVHRT